MRKYLFLYFLASLICISATIAQNEQLSHFEGLTKPEKEFTLNELIPGGKDYYKFYPKIPKQYQWNGDKLIEISNDSVSVYENLISINKKTYLFSYDDIESELEDSTINISRVNFTGKGKKTMLFNSFRGIGFIDLNNKSKTVHFIFPDNSKNQQISPDYNYLAYTKDNNMFILDKNNNETAITDEKDTGIVYGQAVHRNEFGINNGIFWSPSGNKIAFYRMDETMVSEYPIVDMSARTAELQSIRYPMAGMTSHTVSIGIYDTSTGRTIYLNTGEPDDHYLTNISWSPDESFIFVAELNRSQNHMKLNRYNSSTGEFEKTLFEEIHSKYVEPQYPALFVKEKDDKFIWQSRRDGYNHLYLYDITGKLIKQLTTGEWEITDIIGFDEKGENLYFVSTNPTPLERHVYSVELRSGTTKRHTYEPGIHSASISKSGKYIVDRYSAHNNPGQIDLINISNGKVTPLSIANNPFEGINMPSVEQGSIKAADGASDLYYRLVKPADFNEDKKYPVAVYVYGGPHSQMVTNRWRYGSGGWETYMAQKGYLVFVLDNRGTSNRGFEFENVTHRKLGVEESKDQFKGAEFLKSLSYVDENRMGIHGWSYGGFMTINILLRYPDLFKLGVAGGPVTDWKYYEVMYGERYMDNPQDNSEGYEETSLINKADKLQGRLLIIHGDEDPVVVMQHSSQFIKACIKAGTHPDLFIYPGHEHNMMGQDRVHLYEHITRYFDDFINP